MARMTLISRMTRRAHSRSHSRSHSHTHTRARPGSYARWWMTHVLLLTMLAELRWVLRMLWVLRVLWVLWMRSMWLL
jgi:hypothetical protein